MLRYSNLLALTCFAVAPALHGATATFDLQLEGVTGSSITVTPGTDVPYVLVVTITSEDPNVPDNRGLSSFNVSIHTDLRVPQRAMDSFEQIIARDFQVQQSLGTPSQSLLLPGILQDIDNVAGAQNSQPGVQPTLGIGLTQTQILAYGRLATPSTEGTFAAMVRDTSRANVYGPLTFSSFEPAIAVGPGIVITTQAATTTDGTTDGTTDTTGGDTSTDTSTNGSTDTTTPTTTVTDPIMGGLTLAVAIGALIGGALLLGSPIFALAMMVLAPLFGILLLLAGCG